MSSPGHAKVDGQPHAHGHNIDHQGNANLGVWLALIGITFMTGSFVASNVYLRGWNPTKYVFHQQMLHNLPYFDVLMLLVSALLLLAAGAAFARRKWQPFRVLLALSTLSYASVFVTQLQLFVGFADYNQQIATIYAPSQGIELCLTFICLILLVFAGYYASFGNKAKLNAYFPVSMNVWLYTIFAGVVILLLEHVLTIGQFAEWCGLHLT